ncbi:MAG TPA: helix-hairpin-helix domain-containing protein [Desulfobacteraceae bacterium]|nr:helix-hairpin-helix domain-containing protein [Deltaproteobacteria bacterium]MBW2355392.1 helix-hairpin-helix domain-containing protein [Deltaproteobacteria bacterium]HDI59449.1 helix-hairpin-helix domain-containing protein [Desulfobacteraceae bacterium]
MKKIIAVALLALFTMTLSAGAAMAADEKINLNKATREQLMTVPEMTEEIADGILELREENGEFVDIEELMDVDGVDAGKLRIFKKFLKVEAVGGCNC